MRSLMLEAVPLFERASGTKVDVKFALTSVLQKEIEDGTAFDIALLPRPELDALARAGKIAAGTQTDVHPIGGWACGPRRRAEARHRHGRGVQAHAPSGAIGRL
jgi:hypothetical protein